MNNILMFIMALLRLFFVGQIIMNIIPMLLHDVVGVKLSISCGDESTGILLNDSYVIMWLRGSTDIGWVSDAILYGIRGAGFNLRYKLV